MQYNRKGQDMKQGTLTVRKFRQGYQLAVQDRAGIRYYYRVTPEGASKLAARLMMGGHAVIGRDALETLKVAA